MADELHGAADDDGTGTPAPAVTSTTEITRRDAPAADWARKYPPLLTVAVALLMALTVLPSALNLPQSNPQETLEYAPVPPEDEDSSADGNMSALGLGSSAGIEDGGADGGVGPGAPPEVEGGRSDPNIRCSANNQQTFDPLSPPCVPFFEGDNFGKTYSIGVTGDEIRLSFYIDGGIDYITSSAADNRLAPSDAIYDLFKTPEENQKANDENESRPEHITVKAMRVWQAYFNQRFQTYKRRVHFFMHFASGNSPEDRRADAARAMKDIGPFAVVSVAEGNEETFLNAMARKGVLNFGSFGVRPQSFFRGFDRKVWGYLPSVEQQMKSYGSYLCQQVIGREPSLAAPDLRERARLENDGKRRIGILYVNSPDYPGFQLMANLVKKKVEECKGEVEAEATFGTCCLAQDPSGANSMNSQIADFQQKGITTILWTGGITGNWARAAAQSGYLPEYIILGDTILDAKHPVRLSQSSAAFDGRAIVVSPQAFQPALKQQLCSQAYREIDKRTPDQDLAYTCNYYTNLFQFFVGVQVAGPRLTPTTIDKGFHAIPQRYNGSPVVPACFYEQHDYTCVKDGAAYIWDADDVAPGDQQPGCWKGIEGGRRYAPNNWPNENIHERINGSEPCSGYDAKVRFALA